MNVEALKVYNQGISGRRDRFRKALRMNSNPNFLRINDVIEVRLEDIMGKAKSPILARVTGIVERLGSDLIKWVALDGRIHNEVGVSADACDQRFCHLVERSKTPVYASTNLYYWGDDDRYSGRKGSFRSGRGCWIGTPASLATLAVESKPYLNIPYGLNDDLVKKCWEKDGCPGLTGFGKFSWPKIRIKSFTKWVLANVERIKKTKNEWVRDELFGEDLDERLYEDDGMNRREFYYATQGGGVVRAHGTYYVFVEVPENSEFKIDDKMPKSWEVDVVRFHGYNESYDESETEGY